MPAERIARRARISVASSARYSWATFEERLEELPEQSNERVDARLDRHRAFIREHEEPPKYEAVHYDVPVVTKQERRIRLYVVTGVERVSGDGRRYVVSYEPR